MKTAHLVYSFPPDPVGGTEVYVDRLATGLVAQGEEVVVVAPGARTERYGLNGLAVRRYAAAGANLPIDVLYGRGDPRAAAAVSAILAEERPDVVHQHALTPACSVEIAASVKAAGLPLVFTYHTPTVTCTRGTLLEQG